MDRSSDFGDNRVKFRCRKHSHGSESGLFLELSARLGCLLCCPKRHKHSLQLLYHSCYIIKAVAIFALNCITNKKQIQHNIYCFGTISVTYGWAYLWKIFVSVFHYEFTI